MRDTRKIRKAIKDVDEDTKKEIFRELKSSTPEDLRVTIDVICAQHAKAQADNKKLEKEAEKLKEKVETLEKDKEAQQKVAQERNDQIAALKEELIVATSSAIADVEVKKMKKNANNREIIDEKCRDAVFAVANLAAFGASVLADDENSEETAAYVHGPSVPGAGGLPTGTGGRAAVLLSGGIDSPVAGYMIAKRGVEIECIHFFSYPYTSERAKEKVLELARLMTRYCGRMTVDVVGFTKVQEAIRDHCREEYFTIIMRRFMMRIAQAIAKDHGAKCLVTGENLGQVASQTMDAMAVTGAVVDIPMFHPLIGMDKEEIVTRARKIGTLETSILPYEDCCTVFTPKHPKTKPVLALVEAEEAKLDVDALVADALANTEKVAIRYYED